MQWSGAYVCMYAYVYVCLYTYTCIYVCMCTCMYICMYVCTYVRICIYTYVCMHACMYACMHACAPDPCHVCHTLLLTKKSFSIFSMCSTFSILRTLLKDRSRILRLGTVASPDISPMLHRHHHHCHCHCRSHRHCAAVHACAHHIDSRWASKLRLVSGAMKMKLG